MSHHKPQLAKYLRRRKDDYDLRALDLSQFRVYRKNQKGSQLTPLLQILYFSYYNCSSSQLTYLIHNSDLNATVCSHYRDYEFNALFLILQNKNKLEDKTMDYLMDNTNLNYENTHGVKALTCALLNNNHLTSKQWSTLINTFFSPQHISHKSVQYLLNKILEKYNRLLYIRHIWKYIENKNFFMSFIQNMQNSDLYEQLISIDFIDAHTQKIALEQSIAVSETKRAFKI